MHYTARLTPDGDRTLIDFSNALGYSTFAEPSEHIEDVAREARPNHSLHRRFSRRRISGRWIVTPFAS